MKKQLLILIVSVVLATNLVAQRDSIAHKDSAIERKVILEINPTLLMGIIGTTGEFGLYLQIPTANERICISAGGGLNMSYWGTTNESWTYGYTIRTGVYYFLDTKVYVSLQLMYRRWGTLDSVANYSGVFDNSLLNPFDGTLNSPQTSTGAYGNGYPLPYDVDKVTMTSYGIDVVFGRQGPLFKSKHLIFEYYLGAGGRLHSYSIEKIGRYDDYSNTAGQIEYKALATPSFSSELAVYPDLKLGFMIGYKF